MSASAQRKPVAGVHPPASRRASHATRLDRQTVAVIGAGASGMLVSAHLLRIASAEGLPIRVVLIDRNDENGGVAYSTREGAHLLNVTAARMSAFADDGDHFVRWRARARGAVDPGEYAPRGEYRRYLEEVLTRAQLDGGPASSLLRLTAAVAAVEPDADGVRVVLGGRGVLDAGVAVLAVGNLGPRPPDGCASVAEHERYVNDPWSPGALDRVQARGRARVLLIGTGLTMVDVAATLAARCPQARLLAVSRSGLLPRAHAAGRTEPPRAARAPDPGLTLTELVDAVLAQSAAGAPSWHRLVDELRPHTQALWQRLTLAERAEFLRTRHRAWCVRRHRMPPAVAAGLAELIGSGRLDVRTGSVELAPSGSPTGELEARIPGHEPTAVAFAVNCTGPNGDPRLSDDPMILRLLQAGHARAHPLGLGFDTMTGGGLRSDAHAGEPRLFTLGPPRGGELYETTAIPEIRCQAADLAASLTRALALVHHRAAAHASP